MKRELSINDIIILKSSGKKALIVGTKYKPYKNPIYRKDEFPENQNDYIILYYKGIVNGRDVYEGKQSININEIEYNI